MDPWRKNNITARCDGFLRGTTMLPTPQDRRANTEYMESLCGRRFPFEIYLRGLSCTAAFAWTGEKASSRVNENRRSWNHNRAWLRPDPRWVRDIFRSVVPDLWLMGGLKSLVTATYSMLRRTSSTAYADNCVKPCPTSRTSQSRAVDSNNGECHSAAQGCGTVPR